MQKLFSQKIHDAITGTNIVSSYKILKITEKYSKSELEKLQTEKLKKLIKITYDNNQYYKEIFDQKGISPNDIKGINDIGLIPISDKQMFRQAGSKVFSISDLRHVKIGKTGGTTGVPLKYLKDQHTRSVGWAAYYRWYDWMGIDNSDRSISFWGARRVINNRSIINVYHRLLNKIDHHLSLNSFDINDNNLPMIIQKIIKHKPVFISGYLSAILQVAYYLKENNIKIIGTKTVSTTTETLLPPYRKIIEEVFNCPVYDQYGCGECGSIAFECNYHSGLHVSSEHCIVEIVDDNGEKCEYGKIGNVIVTDLDNYAMPFIRYKNGDTAKMINERCDCGINSPIIAAITGRSADTVTLKNGSKVHGVFFTDIISELKLIETMAIKRFQVYQHIPGEIEFRIESEIKLSEISTGRLMAIFERFFNKAVIVYYNILPYEESGKFKYIVSDL